MDPGSIEQAANEADNAAWTLIALRGRLSYAVGLVYWTGGGDREDFVWHFAEALVLLDRAESVLSAGSALGYWHSATQRHTAGKGPLPSRPPSRRPSQGTGSRSDSLMNELLARIDSNRAVRLSAGGNDESERYGAAEEGLGIISDCRRASSELEEQIASIISAVDAGQLFGPSAERMRDALSRLTSAARELLDGAEQLHRDSKRTMS